MDGGLCDCGCGDASIYYLGKRKTSPIQNHNPSVHLFFIQALPHNGGEKNYLEHLFRRPKQLVTSIYASNAVLLGMPHFSTLTSLLTCWPSVRCRKHSCVCRVYSRILWIGSFPIACHIFSCPSRRLHLPYRATERVGIYENWHSPLCRWDRIHRSHWKPSRGSSASRKL